MSRGSSTHATFPVTRLRATKGGSLLSLTTVLAGAGSGSPRSTGALARRLGRPRRKIPSPRGTAATFSSGFAWSAGRSARARTGTGEGACAPLPESACGKLNGDAWRPLEERRNAETTASASYLWGARHRDDLARRDRAVGGTTINETRYVLMDYFNPAAITDETGAVKERCAFSAFGVRSILNPDWTARTSSESAFEFAFQGQFLDTESGLYNYGYRYYSPYLGRWTCKDPIGERGRVNLYCVVGNNAINWVDRLGLENIMGTTNCPNPRTAPVVQSYSGESGTTYPTKTVICKCVQGPDTRPGANKGAVCWKIPECTINFTAQITISFSQARDLGVPHWEIYGHEQQHIQSRCERVKQEVEANYIEKQSQGNSSTEADCNIRKASVEKFALDILNRILDSEQTPDHKGDPGQNPFTPGDKEPFPPLSGSQGPYSHY